MSTLAASSSTATGVKAFVKRNPLISMYIIMSAMAWAHRRFIPRVFSLGFCLKF